MIRYQLINELFFASNKKIDLLGLHCSPYILLNILIFPICIKYNKYLF